ncbi:nucleotide-diphospho-sugar transferase [Lindgomyces ingoldianus]|uniref:Nucleotide-diphospho-sugar transferase n=1 Tax=Lindgomyces ingoldianus TaxID=673940 RepID=A0ACB6REZ1_9PLEO|nr:nucleotide-diphospho-sugar transferase [Lindgomyces ingoldianus]KAF2477057.1 nucleotide-diphospho-sugar transferase [Lindgomyces ingoldianus]
MSDSYLPGAAVLAHSLRDAGTTKKLAVLVTMDTLSTDTISELKSLYDYLIPVERIQSPNLANLYLMGRPDLAFAFTKIALWRQVQFRKIVYIDADVVALRALDELFDLDVPFAAAPDIGWPDAFNTGVMVISPNMGDYWALQTMAASGDSFDGADQGLLNQYYEHRNWHRLSFTYNCTPNAEYQWEPAYRYYKRDISAVHFIGKNKPWSTGRSGPGGSGVYNELLARWWAVYDRHLKPAAETAATAQAGYESSDRRSSTVQEHVHGEATSTEFGTSSISHITPTPEIVETEGPVTTTEQSFSDPGDLAENIDQGVVEPTPTVEQRRFSAPQMEWDATRFEPPAESKPEAVHFPTQTYEFSESRELFHAPQSYPEPPKDMWYQVPETKPAPAEKPKPIFPWEREPDRPKPTRVFAEDLPPPPMPSLAPAFTQSTHPFSTVHYEEGGTPIQEEVQTAGPTSPPRSSSPKTADEQWQEFQHSNVNAWDTVPGIDTYVRAIMEAQNRRGKPQVLHQARGEEIPSPSISRKERRESLILTDFPSAVERPSLPVTPAPVRRPTFWGEERDVAGELPPAEGVPDQAEWNPEERLDQLRRSSVLEFEHLKAPVHSQPPLRELPEHSIPKRETSVHHHVPLSGGSSPHELDQLTQGGSKTDVKSPEPASTEKSATTPIFKEPDFGADGGSDETAGLFTGKKEDVLSPTER